MDITSKKVLITGTAGFIGFHLTKLFLSAGAEVVGLDCINDYYDINLKYDRLKETGIDKDSIDPGKLVQSQLFEKYRFIKLDLSEREVMHKLFEEEKFDIVINLAAQAGVRYSIQNPYTYIESNISGFLNILEGCRHYGVKHLVYASSSSVYGKNKKQPFSETDFVDNPISLYAASKKTNELMAHTYSHLYNIPTTGLRFFTVYGPWGRPDMALFLFTKAIYEGRAIDIYNHGDMQRDFTYIDDIVNGILNVTKAVPEGETPYQLFNIGNSHPENLLRFVEVLEEKIGKTAEKNFMPMQAGDVKATYADVERLEKIANYKPDTSIEVGVSNFIDWYRKYYKV